KHRAGVLFYEATEGGAGVLTRLVNDPDALALVARQALRVMHYDVPTDPAHPWPTFEDMVDQPETRCVAGCYRCLLSYYNQPDHELIHRQDEHARRILWRLAQIETRLDADPTTPELPAEPDPAPGWVGQWQQAAARQVPSAPPPVHARLESAELLHWPDHYVAVALPDTSRDLQAAWEDRGYTFVRFPADTNAWALLFQRLTRLLGL